MPDGAARTHNPSFGGGNKRDAVKIFCCRTRNAIPPHAPVNRVENRPFVIDKPTSLFPREIDRVERGGRAGRPCGPILTAGTGKEYLAAFADSPAVRVVDKENVCEVVAAAVGESFPRQTAIVSTHDETISAGRPANRLI